MSRNQDCVLVIEIAANDIRSYYSEQAAVTAIEPPEVESDAYLIVTASGDRLRPHTDGYRVWLTREVLTDEDRAKARRITEFAIRATTGRVDENWRWDELIRFAVSHFADASS